MPSYSAELQAFITSKTACVLSMPGCPFCRRAVELLKSKNIDFVEVNATDSSTPYPKLFDEVTSRHGHDSYPAIFVKGEFIGGNSELQSFNKAGKL